MRKKLFMGVLCAAALSAMPSCGSNGNEGNETAPAEIETMTDDEAAAITTDEALETPSWMPDSVQVQPSGLGVVIDNPGDNTRATASSAVTLHYRGYLPDGTVFDSSYDRGEPATFSPSQVIPGFGEGIMMLGKGGKATLYIPSNLGYGPYGGPGGVIGPNQNLIFDIELIDIK